MSEQDKRILINLICDRQTEMIVNDNAAYTSDYYQRLENLKAEIKDLGRRLKCKHVI